MTRFVTSIVALFALTQNWNYDRLFPNNSRKCTCNFFFSPFPRLTGTAGTALLAPNADTTALYRGTGAIATPIWLECVVRILLIVLWCSLGYVVRKMSRPPPPCSCLRHCNWKGKRGESLDYDLSMIWMHNLVIVKHVVYTTNLLYWQLYDTKYIIA